jgi:hypothetical protein
MQLDGSRMLRFATQPAFALFVFGALCGLFVVVLHPWFMNWGATSQERSMVLPGDTAPPETYFTRAISIDAPPSAVWPWLLAIGQDRAGFLSNDYLENLTGADIHNADVLRPEWQQRELGDRVPMTNPGQRALFGDVTSTTIHLLEPERAIADTPGRFVLLPVSDAESRLLLRESLDDPIRAGAAWIVWDPMHFVMEQRLLQGVKERAEGRPLIVPLVRVAALAGWALAASGLIALFLSRRGWRPWLVVPVGLMLLPLWQTGDGASFTAGFVAVGITLAGFLAFGWRWCAPYLLIASSVALVLLLAADSFTAFGLIFLALSAIGAFSARHRVAVRVRQHPVLAYFVLAFGISWVAIVWLVAPTGTPGTGSDYLARGPLVFLAYREPVASAGDARQLHRRAGAAHANADFVGEWNGVVRSVRRHAVACRRRRRRGGTVAAGSPRWVS